MGETAEVTQMPVDFDSLPHLRLAEMAAAGETIGECCRVLGRTTDNVVGELLRDQGTFYAWNHYPDGDVYDHHSHSQYYFHSHPSELRGGEHGHFHLFMRPKGMPAGIRPAPVPDLALPEGDNAALSHLVGISMDEFGVPIRLFTTNRWVTGEIWYAAADVERMLDCFVIDHVRPSWAVNRWVSAMIRLFRPQIVALIAARDHVVAAWQDGHLEGNVYEDRALEVTAQTEISVDDQRRAVEQALGRRG